MLYYVLFIYDEIQAAFCSFLPADGCKSANAQGSKKYSRKDKFACSKNKIIYTRYHFCKFKGCFCGWSAHQAFVWNHYLNTIKNQVSARTGTGFYFDLRSRYETTGGGYDWSQIGAQAFVHAIDADETRTVQFTFAKDITAMGRAGLECMIRLDWSNLIDESDENNNYSGLFDVIPPRLWTAKKLKMY